MEHCAKHVVSRSAALARTINYPSYTLKEKTMHYTSCTSRAFERLFWLAAHLRPLESEDFGVPRLSPNPFPCLLPFGEAGTKMTAALFGECLVFLTRVEIAVLPSPQPSD
jgi:hypothetical protein